MGVFMIWSLVLLALVPVKAQFDFDFGSFAVPSDVDPVATTKKTTTTATVKDLSVSAAVCDKYTDLLVVAEYPDKDRAEAHKQIEQFYLNLKIDTKGDACTKFAFVIADTEVVVVKELSKSDGVFPKVDVSRTVGKKPKQNLLQIIEEITDGKYFEDSKDRSEKIILFILSSAKDDDIPVADKMKSVLEERSNIVGPIGIPAQKFSILAVGVAIAADIDHLYRITFEKNRCVAIPSWRTLDKYERRSSYDRIYRLIKNPNYVTFSIGALKSNEGTEPLNANSEDVGKNEICQYAVDVAFLVDSSYSIRLDWDKELFFIQRIANRLKISEGGTHAGVVVFSDLTEFTRVEINMTDYTNTNEFNIAVQKLPYIGYRTRMDYGFKKVINELFTPAGGVRPKSFGKMVILITDGKQNPLKAKKTDEIYDPTKASQPLIDEGVAIVAIGIGSDVDVEQLNNVTRDPAKVSLADSITELISDKFVKSMAKKICETGGVTDSKTTRKPVATTECPPKKPACSGVGNCASCCGSRDIYINIFKSAGNYLVQGMQIQSTSGQITGAVLPAVSPTVNLTKNGNTVDNTPKTTTEVLKLIETLLPQRAGLSEQLKNLIADHDNNQPEHGLGLLAGRPGVTLRKRRSLDDTPTQGAELSLFKIARLAGCRLFLSALRKHNMLKMVMKVSKEKNLDFILFCPTDDVFKKNYNKFNSNEKEVFMNHIVLKSQGMNISHVLQPQLPGSKIRITPRIMNKNKIFWKANNANILFSLVNNGRGQIMVIDDILYPNTKTLDQVLKGNADISMFYKLLRLIPMKETLKYNRIEKICFQSGLCASLHDSLQVKLQQHILQPSSFTILAPTNREMLKMSKTKLTKLHTDRPALISWLKEHFFIGRFVAEKTEHEELLVSIAPSHSVLSRVKGMDKKSSGMQLNVLDRVLETKESISFSEGIVHVYESL